MTPTEERDALADFRMFRVAAAAPWSHPLFMLAAFAGLRCWANTDDIHAAAWWAGTVGCCGYGFGLVLGWVASGIGRIGKLGQSEQDVLDRARGRALRLGVSP
jgi:hypothetical protein